jgi:hypothetical protein
VLILVDQDRLRTDDEATWIVANRRASSWIITVDDGSAGPLGQRAGGQRDPPSAPRELVRRAFRQTW